MSMYQTKPKQNTNANLEKVLVDGELVKFCPTCHTIIDLTCTTKNTLAQKTEKIYTGYLYGEPEESLHIRVDCPICRYGPMNNCKSYTPTSIQIKQKTITIDDEALREFGDKVIKRLDDFLKDARSKMVTDVKDMLNHYEDMKQGMFTDIFKEK